MIGTKHNSVNNIGWCLIACTLPLIFLGSWYNLKNGTFWNHKEMYSLLVLSCAAIAGFYMIRYGRKFTNTSQEDAINSLSDKIANIMAKIIIGLIVLAVPISLILIYFYGVQIFTFMFDHIGATLLCGLLVAGFYKSIFSGVSSGGRSTNYGRSTASIKQSSSAASAVSTQIFRSNSKCCGTCKYWQGARSVMNSGNQIKASLVHETCAVSLMTQNPNTGKGKTGSKIDHLPHMGTNCSDWRSWI